MLISVGGVCCLSSRRRHTSFALVTGVQTWSLPIYYDKLTLTVETDCTVTPEDAVAYAARILLDQLQLFVNFEEPAQGASAPIGLAAAPAEAEAESGQINRYLLKKVDELELSVRSANCLQNEIGRASCRERVCQYV